MKGGIKSWRINIMVVMIVVVVVFMWEVKTGRAEVSAEECKEERRIGIDLCKQVVYGNDPTPACCERVRLTHLECVCPMITPKLAPLIDVNRAVRLIEGCGRKVPRHFKCGGTYVLSISISISISISYPFFSFFFFYVFFDINSFYILRHNTLSWI